MNTGERLKLFIETYFHTQLEFAGVVQMSKDSINKYINTKTLPSADSFIKFNDIGLSIDWLLNGHGSMFANNEPGLVLSKKIVKEFDKTQNTPLSRIKYWIDLNYESLEVFSIIFNIDYKSLSIYFETEMLDDISFFKLMGKAGCSISWISSGIGSMYEKNYLGKMLKEHQEMKLHDDPDSTSKTASPFDEIVFMFQMASNMMQYKNKGNKENEK